MAQLSLKLLGAPEVRHGERQLLFPTRKTLAILIYLLVEGGRHTRDKLTALFWPDSDQVRGRASLRRALSSIRQTIDDLDRSPSSQHLLVEQDVVGTNILADLDIDLRSIEAALAANESDQTQLAALERAAALCRGD